MSDQLGSVGFVVHVLTGMGVNSYWAQGLTPPLLWSWGSPIWRAPPHFCDVILSKLYFNCSHWFYAMPTNRQLDHSFPAVLDIFGKGLNLPAPLDIQWPKCFQLQGGGRSPPDQGLYPWTPLGALPPDPRYIGLCSALAMMPPPTSAAYDPRTSSPPTYFDKFTPMIANIQLRSWRLGGAMKRWYTVSDGQTANQNSNLS